MALTKAEMAEALFAELGLNKREAPTCCLKQRSSLRRP